MPCQRGGEPSSPPYLRRLTYPPPYCLRPMPIASSLLQAQGVVSISIPVTRTLSIPSGGLGSFTARGIPHCPGLNNTHSLEVYQQLRSCG